MSRQFKNTYALSGIHVNLVLFEFYVEDIRFGF